MTTWRTIWSAALAIAIIASTTTAAAFGAADAHWAEETVQSWQDEELIVGNGDGGFQPDQALTRAEFSASLNRILQLASTGPSKFQDVSADSWYQPDIVALEAAGVLEQSRGNYFYPEQPIMRQEAAVMFARAFQLLDAPEAAEIFVDLERIDPTAAGSVGALVKAGFLSGYPDGSFGPHAYLTYAEAIAIFDSAKLMIRSYLDGNDYGESLKSLNFKPYTGPNMSKGLNKEQSVQYIDISRGNQQPITGYFYISFPVNGVTRTAKIYIPEGAALRCYFTVLSVPDGWNTEHFLAKSGWLELADTVNEGLFILEAGDGNGTWGAASEEYDYVKTALSSAGLEGKTFYNLHGVHYLAGYGTGGTALQEWAINTPSRSSVQYLSIPKT